MPATLPRVSVVVPCFNAAPWLSACLESALHQTWGNTEVIVVDDGSTDGSLKIAEQFVPRGVQLLAQPNRGASAARNAGIRAAQGDYVQYLDADDLLHPNKLEIQVTSLQRIGPREIASARWGRFEQDPVSARFVDTPVFRNMSAMEFLQLSATEGCMMHPAAWLTPVEVVREAGPWNESLSLNDDGEYFARILLAGTGITFCAEAETYYRSAVGGSLSSLKSESARRSLFKSLELIAGHMLKAEDAPSVRQAVAALFIRGLHEIYPAPRDLLESAYARIAEFDGKVTDPPMGPRAAAVARVIGWKLTRRIQSLLESRRARHRRS